MDVLGKDVGLILASQSPRRREILDMMGLAGKYTATPSPLNEEAIQDDLKRENDTPRQYTRVLAERKAHALAIALLDNNNLSMPTLVLGSDTIVDQDGQILEKPKDTQESHRMLSQLSGSSHQVHTGVAIYLTLPPSSSSSSEEGRVQLVSSFTDTADVRFAPLQEQDIKAYIATGEPMDKAGSYGIQGIGGQFVQSIQGDFFTVMGLPMHPVSRELTKAIDQALLLAPQ